MELFTNFKTDYRINIFMVSKILLKKIKKMNEVTLKQINDYESILKKKNYMKVVILAGGLGTRLSEYTLDHT